jgi:hypothetical protein
MMTYCNAFYARLYGYIAILTDDYPPVGLEKAIAPPSPEPPAPASPPPPAPAV